MGEGLAAVRWAAIIILLWIIVMGLHSVEVKLDALMDSFGVEGPR